MSSKILGGFDTNFKRIENFVFDLISFGSPLAIVINLSLIIIFLFLIPTEILVLLPVRSVFKDFLLPFLFNGKCPDSGFFKNCSVYSTGETRALSRILHGDLIGAYNYNPLVFLVLIVMIILIIINLKKIFLTKSKNN